MSDVGILLLTSALDVEATFAESSVDALGDGILFSIEKIHIFYLIIGLVIAFHPTIRSFL